MRAAKSTKALARINRMDILEDKLRSALRGDTTNAIEIGKILLAIRDELDHGKWLQWLAENFDLSQRSAYRYIKVAEYAGSKVATVANLADLSVTVLYALAEGGYTAKEEAEILKRVKVGHRIDQGQAAAICAALKPPPPPPPDSDDAEAETPAPADDDDIEKILGGPPPNVPPPAPIATPDFALRDFDQAVSALKQLTTKSAAHFGNTTHSADDLESIEQFIHLVRQQKESPPRGKRS